MSHGEIPEDALANAKEAAECRLPAASEDGMTLPQLRILTLFIICVHKNNLTDGKVR